MQKIAIGLGSNIGDRQDAIRQAVRLMEGFIQNIRLSCLHETPALLTDDAPEEWNQPFLNAALTGDTDLSPHELLEKLQEIENELGRKRIGKWSPRTIDLDILLYGEKIIESKELTLPHPEMLKRDFVMKPLLEIASDWIEPISQRPLYIHKKPQIIGIVNITPDSFSDGGKAYSPQDAITHAETLLADGADMLDLGAESTRPNAVPVSAEEEWSRLEPVINHLQGKARFSVDTRHHQTAIKALKLGCEMINDVSAASNFSLIEAVAAHENAAYVLMHSLSVPADPCLTMPKDSDVVQEVLAFAQEKISMLEKMGLAKSRIIFDPGIGFGKTAEQSLELIERIEEFHKLNVPLYVGHSRKSFMRLFTDAPAHERDALTLEFSKKLIQKGVTYLRVHHVEMHHGF